MKIKDLLSELGFAVAEFAKGVSEVLQETSEAGEKPEKAKSGKKARKAKKRERRADAAALPAAIREGEPAAAKVAEKPRRIEECSISVQDVPYTGRKIEKPAVTLSFGDKSLREGEDYSLRYDRKAREIGLYRLHIEGLGEFTGAADASFFVVPKTKALLKFLSGDKEAALDWSCLQEGACFQIKYSRSEYFYDSREETLGKAEDLNRFVRGLTVGEKYCARVRVCAVDGGETRCSAWSKIKTLKP